MAPKTYGSCTKDLKKSTVWTITWPGGGGLMTAASSGASKPTSMSVCADAPLAMGSRCRTLLKMLAPTYHSSIHHSIGPLEQASKYTYSTLLAALAFTKCNASSSAGIILHQPRLIVHGIWKLECKDVCVSMPI